MVPVSIVEERLANQLVKKYKPIIYQGWQDIRDFITPLMLEEIASTEDEKEHVLRLVDCIKRPTLYYKVMEDSKWYYIATVVYHPWDWSDFPVKFVQKMDSHRHDSETILLRVKKNRLLPKERIDSCSVFHSGFVFKKRSNRQFYIQSEGHGIKPFNPKMLKEERNFVRYAKYNFVNWAHVPKKEWEEIRKKFNGVNLPDTQYDGQFKLRFAMRKDGLDHQLGDAWNRPNVLFRLSEISNRLN